VLCAKVIVPAPIIVPLLTTDSILHLHRTNSLIELFGHGRNEPKLSHVVNNSISARWMVARMLGGYWQLI